MQQSLDFESKKSEALDVLVAMANDVDANYLVMFTYGTLRPGEGNYWIEPEVVRYWEPATTKGRMYVGGIPFVDFVGCGIKERVVGTVLVIDRGELTDSMCHMELGAGYVPMTVPVTVVQGANSVTVECLVWHYDRPLGSWATYVPSGDFRDTAGSRYADR